MAYHDSGWTNQGGAYRNDGVDIEVTTDVGGGYHVSHITGHLGEWLEYIVLEYKGL